MFSSPHVGRRRAPMPRSWADGSVGVLSEGSPFLLRALVHTTQAGGGGLPARATPRDQHAQGQQIRDGVQQEGRNLNAARLQQKLEGDGGAEEQSPDDRPQGMPL